MTLEGWPDLVSSVMVKYPFAWLLFIPFILITSYVFLNLVIGIIVTAMQDINLKKNSTIKKELDAIRELREELQTLSLQVDAMSKILNKNNSKDNGDEQ
jgi:voltage-gated sodium channel